MEAAAVVAEFERQRAPPSLCNASYSTTMSPGHKAILEAHAQSHSNAIIYVAVVLLIYVVALLIVTLQYMRSERSAVHRGSIYQSYHKRDRTSSKKRYTPPAPSGESPESPVKNPNSNPAAASALMGAPSCKIDKIEDECMV